MFSRKALGIMMIIALAAGVAITTTRCYDDDKDARVTIHLQRNDLAYTGQQHEKHLIDRVLEFFSTRAFAVTGWDGTHYDLTLSVSSPSFQTVTYSIPLSVTQYSLVIPSANDTTFKATCVSVIGGGYKNWGGHKTLNLGPGDQDITLNMIPMTQITASNGTSISLSWEATDSSGNTLSYNIYRSTSADGEYILIKNVTPATALSTTDTPPAAGTYYYKISVVSTSGEEGVLSDPDSAVRS